MALDYPDTERSDHSDDYHGTRVPDPYRWLEQSAHTPEVRAWIEAQNELTFNYLEGLSARERIRERLTELWDYPKKGAPFKKGEGYFQFRNSGLQNQNVLYAMDAPEAEGRVLLDPNALSEDGTVSLNALSVSKDACYLAYATSEGGSDWQTWRVREVETGKDLAEGLAWSKFSGATWHPDGSGFFYLRFPAPEEGKAYTDTNENAQLCFHTLGTPQSEDAVIYQRPDEPQWSFYPAVSDDERYLVLYVYHGTDQKNLIYYRSLGQEEDFNELIPDWEAGYYFLGNDGETFYFLTNFEADRGRVVAIDIDKPDKSDWRTLVPETEDTLSDVKMLGDEFICLYKHDARHQLKRLSLAGEYLGDIELPDFGSLLILNAEREDEEMFYTLTSFLYPDTTFKFDPVSGSATLLFQPDSDFNSESYTTRQVFVTSKDGTKVPMFLVHRKNVETDGQNPTLLYGYGGFNVPVKPVFMQNWAVWLELGGVLAVTNLRGGGEYSKAWHEAGTLSNKQNVFDDSIACAEYLIDKGVTSPEKLAIEGRSNGGLLVGAAMTQRPELFAAALPGVGVLDMLRFHKFTIGWAWVSDYGSADDPEQFKTLLAYSPLHALKPGTTYPATLITTGDFDDRVVPAHSFKFAAALQHAQAGDAPTLIRVQTKAGHGMGKPTKMVIEERADILAFLTEALEVEK